MKKKYLYDMTYEEAAVAFRETDTALISTGSIAQHAYLTAVISAGCFVLLPYLSFWKLLRLPMPNGILI